jgi:molybdopterin-dependent oxidoreductase alpha subunit
LDRLSWDEIVSKSGVTLEEIDQIARIYAAADRVIFSWTMGITHHAHGVQNVQAITNLALSRGKVGRKGCGLMPIRGHSNVQGIGSVGVTPQLKQAIFNNLRDHFHLQLPVTAGKDTLGCMESAAGGTMKLGFCLGGNLYGSNPDAKFAAAAMEKLQMSVFLSTTLNTGHVHGLADQTIILPVLARDEEPEITTQESMFNYVRVSDGGPRRLPGPRSEVQIIAELGKRLQVGQPAIEWDQLGQTKTIRRWIAKVVPGFEAIEQVDSTKQEFQIAGRTLHQPTFPTADGRAQLHVHSLPDLMAQGPDELRLMTVRSEGQFNTVVYEEEDLYRHQDRRDVILMHPVDLQRLGLQHDQPVTVTSSTGAMQGLLARSFEQIRPGNALMYYPEANVLVPRQADPQSRTPAFKCIPIKVQPFKL